jgi:SnoaL-like polyketide cyclase
LEVRSRTAEGDREVLEWIFRGTSATPFGTLPATGEAGELRGVSVCVVAGGHLREERVYWDTATLMAAAGLLG